MSRSHGVGCTGQLSNTKGLKETSEVDDHMILFMVQTRGLKQGPESAQYRLQSTGWLWTM